MPRKKETLTLSVPSGTKEKLEAIAARLNILWGNKPSPSGLVTAIAQQDFEVNQPFKLSAPQVKALMQSVRVLTDSGRIDDAKSVLTLLIDRGELEVPLRQSLMQQISQPMEGWRIQVDQLIQQQQPFHLIYGTPQGDTYEYTVRYAEVLFIEKRYYLQIWCEETDDSTDLPELRHNRCLRLDRIRAILPTSGVWRDRFDTIEVCLHFSGSLAQAYELKEEDLRQEWSGEVRQVVRKVVNPFWLYREVRRYGASCKIVSPDVVRDRFKQELEKMLKQYED
jgi:predicted DNA-binding transcriptional regulator YafY